MAKLSVTDVPVKGKRVLVRVDFNVPLDENLNISDESRILGALPTIKYLVENGAKTILCSHLGRPKGKVVPEMSLAPVAKRLAELLPNVKVAFASDSVGEDAKTKAEQLGEGEVLLLENLRFSKEEEKNDPEFAKALASLADVFVSDAFGTVHRAHASTEGVAHYLPAVCGFLIEKELSVMGGALANPARPFVSILGGKKVGDKIGVIRNLLDKCDTLLIGGAMSYTFFKLCQFSYDRKQPAVISLSLGSNVGPHDKSSIMNQFLELTATKAEDNPMPPVLCVSAGNEGDRRICLRKRLHAGESFRTLIWPSVYQYDPDVENSVTAYQDNVAIYSQDSTRLTVVARLYNVDRGYRVAASMPALSEGVGAYYISDSSFQVTSSDQID